VQRGISTFIGNTETDSSAWERHCAGIGVKVGGLRAVCSPAWGDASSKLLCDVQCWHLFLPAQACLKRTAKQCCNLISTTEKYDVFDRQLAKALRCPQSRSPVTLAESELLERVNRGIAAGYVTNLGGHQLDQPLDAGLIREAGDLLYPVINAIPVMLPDEAVDLSQIQEDW